jgi:hypothetical protein
VVRLTVVRLTVVRLTVVQLTWCGGLAAWLARPPVRHKSGRATCDPTTWSGLAEAAQLARESRGGAISPRSFVVLCSR